MTYGERILELELRIKQIQPHLTKGESWRTEHQSLLKRIAILKRFQKSEELGPTTNYDGEVRDHLPQEIYKFDISTFQLHDLFTIPPIGHLGVIPLFPGVEKPKIGEILEFIHQGKFYATGIVVALEPPGSCLRSDIEGKHANKWKLHWVPFDFYETNAHSS